MPDPFDTSPMGPDPNTQARIPCSDSASRQPGIVTEGQARTSEPISKAPTLSPPDRTTAMAPDAGATLGLPGADETGLVDGAEQRPAPAQADQVWGGLAEYRNRTVVGTWSHGRIEAAEHARLARRVVLRILDVDAACDPALRKEFLREARAVALLKHPNVATDVLEANGDGLEPYVAFALSEDRPRLGLGPCQDWLRIRNSLPYDNRRLARLLTGAARGLQALHQAGLVHGYLRAESLRLAARADWIRLHDLPSMPLIIESHGAVLPRGDLADLAAAIADLVTDNKASPRSPRAGSSARDLRRANPGLDPDLVQLLSRCQGTEHLDRLDQVDELIARLDPLTRQCNVLASWGDRLFTLLADWFLAFIASILVAMTLNQLVSLDILYLPNSGASIPSFFLIIALLVLPLFEVCLGWTPGRRGRGLRLVDVSGTRAPRAKILLRAMLRLGWIATSVAIFYGIPWLLARAVGPMWNGPSLSRFEWLAGSLGAAGFLLATGLLTRSHLPLYDVLTGVTWCLRQRVDPPPDFAPTATPGPGPVRREPAEDIGIPGERVGPNRLERELGRGGMGTVFAAWDEVLDRPVAVKLITGTRDASPEVLTRFEQEARLAAQVRHENVAQVFSVGQDRHRPYMVLELLHGMTLQQLVEERGPLPLGEAWWFITQAATGLQAANRLGIVHRDIKPSNLMLTDDGVVKVLDFGISKLVVDEDQTTDIDLAAEADRLRSDPAWRDAHLTRTGALLGTPLYMSPEQANRRRLDCRSDIYSLGMTLYHLLAGHPPFDSRDVLDLIQMQCHATPPSLKKSVRGLTPERLEVLERMIAKDPAGRFQDYEEMLEALHATAPRPPERAAFGPRVLAAIIDRLLFAGLPLLFSPLHLTGLPERIIDLVAINLTWIVPVVGVWRWGATPGLWLVRLRVIRPDGDRVSLGRSLLRQIVFDPSQDVMPSSTTVSWLGWSGLRKTLTLVLWFVSSILMSRPRRQAVHDRVADTIVIRVPRRPVRRRGRRAPR